MVAEKNAYHNFAKGKVISKCKNDKPEKKLNRKSGCSPLEQGVKYVQTLPRWYYSKTYLL